MAKSTLYQLINSGDVDARRFGRAVRIPWSWLNEQAENRKPQEHTGVVIGKLTPKYEPLPINLETSRT